MLHLHLGEPYGERSHVWALYPKKTQDWLERAVERLQEMTQTCALDVADQGEQTLDTLGNILGLTRERIRQIEAKAIKRAGPMAKYLKLNKLLED